MCSQLCFVLYCLAGGELCRNTHKRVKQKRVLICKNVNLMFAKFISQTQKFSPSSWNKKHIIVRFLALAQSPNRSPITCVDQLMIKYCNVMLANLPAGECKQRELRTDTKRSGSAPHLIRPHNPPEKLLKSIKIPHKPELEERRWVVDKLWSQERRLSNNLSGENHLVDMLTLCVKLKHIMIK